MPTFGSLFAGIGGIDLGLERAGWTGRWQVEWDGYCQRVLAKHWPDVTRYGDITTVDWSQVEPVDLVAGGFPCQPWSTAGKRKGLADDRWLWPEFARAVREVAPRYVLVENVPGLLVGGGMDLILGDLADLGYDTEWESIPAAAVGAPHLRYRVWIVAWNAHRRDEGAVGGVRVGTVANPSRGCSADVAHPDGIGSGRAAEVGQARLARLCPSQAGPEPDGPGDGAMADPDELGLPGGDHDRSGQGLGAPWDELARSRGALGGQWATEPDVGRVAHGVPARVDRLRSLGNAVVPQVVEFIGRRILEAEAMT